MNRQIAKIVGLLDSEDRDTRWAAAVILGALNPADSGVVDALGKALEREDPKLRTAALRSIGSIGAADAFDAVSGMLDVPGEAGQQALEVLFELGPTTLRRLKRRFGSMGEVGRRRILTLAARLRGADGMDLIVQALDQGRAAEVAGIGGRLADELASATGRERNTLVRRLDRFLTERSDAAGADEIGAALSLLARVAGIKAQARLLSYAGPRNPPRVRRRALDALGAIGTKEKLDPNLLNEVLGFLQDPDFGNVVAPAMAVLERTRLSAAHASALLRCVESRDPALRRFAVTALGQLDTPRSAQALLGILRGDNPDLQKRAAESLSRIKAAVPLVADSLAEAQDAHTAWVLARILLPHIHRLKPAQVARLAGSAAAWLEPGDPRAEAVLTVLRDRFTGALLEASMKRIKKLRRSRQAGQILNLLRPLVREGVPLPPEAAYEQALAEIMRGPKEVVREVRLHNAGLQELAELLHVPDFPLLTRLKRDKSVLDPEEYYLIGCHFAERSYADKSFGGDLLRWLVQTFPDEAAARAAEHKLHMEGFPPPPRPRPRKKSPAKRKAAAAKKKPPAKRKAAAAKKKPLAKRKAAAAKKKPVAKKKPAARRAAHRKPAVSRTKALATTKKKKARAPAARKKASRSRKR